MQRGRKVRVTHRGDHLILDNKLLRVDIDLLGGTWNLAAPKGSPFRAAKLFARARVDDRWVETIGRPVESWKTEEIVDAIGQGTKVELAFRSEGDAPGLALTVLVYQGRPSMALKLSVKNQAARTAHIGELRPAEMESARGGSLHLGEGLESARFYEESNNMYGAAVRYLARAVEADKDAGNPFAGKKPDQEAGAIFHQSGWVGLVFNPRSRVAFLAGFLTVELALSKVVARYRPDPGITSWFAACKYDGLAVEPGRLLASEELCIDVRSDPFQALETFAQDVAGANKLPAVPEPMALWCSWYAYRLKLTEEEVLKNARVMAERFLRFGVKVVQMDYGWNYKDTPGEWSHNEERFPHGLRWLVDQLQGLGLELGLWIGPFIAFEQSRFFKEHPECTVKDASGKPSAWQTPWPWEPKQPIHDLDLRQPRAREFLSQTFTELRALGVKYFKMDFLNGPSAAPLSFWHGIRNEDRVRDGERMRIGLSTIRRAVGDDAYLLACNLPHSHALGIVNSVFSAIDAGNAYHGREEAWRHFRRRTSSMIARWYQQGKLWRCDPDIIYVGGNPPDFLDVCEPHEARIRTTVVGLSGGPVVLGDNLARLPKERLAMYELCLPATGVSARPVDLFTSEYARIWDMKVQSDWGSWDVVGLFNYEAEEATIPVSFADLGLDARKQYCVWEFWAREFLGVHRGSIAVKTPARDARVLLVKELPRVPTVLSTSFHMTQGGVELTGVIWDNRRRTLSGTCRRPAGARGELFLYAPAGWKVASGDVEITPAGGAAAGVYRMELSLAGDTLDWRVAFSR